MSVRIAPLQPAEDREALLALWRRNLPAATAARFAWLYERGGAKGWLARNDAGAAIGATGLLPRRCSLQGVPHSAGLAIDLNVDAGQRTLGLALQLQRRVLEELTGSGMLLAYGTPAPQAQAVLRRIGYQELGRLERWVKPLRAEFHLRKFLGPSWLRRATGWLIDRALIFRRGLVPPGPGQSVGEQEVFDASFDELWTAAAGNFTLVGERTAAFLTWRFSRSPWPGARIFCLRAHDGRLLGYCVFRRDQDQVISVLDFFYRSPATAEQTWIQFVQWAFREKANAITVHLLGNPQLTPLLERLRFIRRSQEQAVWVYPVGERQGSAQPTNWFLTQADFDTEN